MTDLNHPVTGNPVTEQKQLLTAALPETGLKKRIDTILLGALSGGEARYKTSDGYTKWGVVQDDIHQAIEESAVALYASGPLPELPTEDMLAAIHSYGGDESDDWRTSAAIKYANLLKAIPKTVSTIQPSLGEQVAWVATDPGGGRVLFWKHTFDAEWVAEHYPNAEPLYALSAIQPNDDSAPLSTTTHA